MIHRSWPLLLGILFVSSATVPLNAQGEPSQRSAVGAILQALRIVGASIYSEQELANRHQLAIGRPLETSVDDLAREIRSQYHEDGYTLATVSAAFNDSNGALTVTVDEGRFEAIDVAGLDAPARQIILDRLALQPGELFNVSQAEHALDDALAPAGGAIERAQPTFELVTNAGRRVLQIALRTRSQESGVFAGSQGREDWYSPVDAFNLAVGLHGTIFDRTRFNHTYWSGYVGDKFGPDRAGYSFGIERQLLGDGLLVVGGSIQDLTTSDDWWRLAHSEQSLVALTFRNSFRDYYRRKGYQLHAALRPLGGHEVVLAWRDESHSALVNETNYGVFRDSHAFRSNAIAEPGDLRAVVVGYTFDSRSLSQQTSERYQRHLLDDLFGEGGNREQGVRVDWRSEIAPASFDQDFDFSRHILNVRGWWHASAGRMLSGRLLAGTSTGTLPPQRALALGGIGSVRGYGFKEQSGDGMLLMNGEYRHELWKSEVAGLVFLDMGRVYGQSPSATATWMRGVGVGLELDGGARIEFGWRLDDVPSSLQVLFRLRPSF